MCSVIMCVRNETSPTFNFRNGLHTTEVVTGTHETAYGHSEPIAHDEGTAYDVIWQKPKYDDDPDY